MTDRIRIMVNGALGRMGQTVIRLVGGEEDLQLTAALEQPGHPSLGLDAGEAAGLGPIGIEVTSDLGIGDVLIDFSAPQSAVQRAAACAEKGVALVIGTTGLGAPEMEVLRKIATRVPCLQSFNMSLGIALATHLITELAKGLPIDFDAEIVETHHRHKKDSPSGTAIRLANAIAKGRGDAAPRLVHGRKGGDLKRGAGEIAIHALRMGEETGEHRVVFSGPAERIEVSHIAHSRDAFARGALLAARFVHGRVPGLYDIADVFLSKGRPSRAPG